MHGISLTNIKFTSTTSHLQHTTTTKICESQELDGRVVLPQFLGSAILWTISTCDKSSDSEALHSIACLVLGRVV